MTGPQTCHRPVAAMPFQTIQFLCLVQLAFTIWMLVDCTRRERLAARWFWAILLVPVFGAWAYFASVKSEEYLALLFGQQQPTLDELREEAEQAPTLARELALAEALI